MKALSNKNAIVGYMTLKLASRYMRRRRKRDRGGSRIAFYVALGIVSAGLLAGLVYFWRQQATAVEDVAGEPAGIGEDALEEAAGPTGEADAAGSDAIADATDEVSAQAASVTEDLPQALEPTSAT